MAQFKSNAPFWRLVLLSETFIFCVLVSWLKASQPPWVICVCGAIVRSCFGLATWLKKPYLYLREGQVDTQTRSVTIVLFILGAMLDRMWDKRHLSSRSPDSNYQQKKYGDESDEYRYQRQLIDVVGVTLIMCNWLRLLYLCRFHEMVDAFVRKIIERCDAQCVALMISYIDLKCFVFEDSNYGLQMMRQWDAIILRQQKTKLVAWPSPRPANLLTWYEKWFVIRWAAARDIRLATMRTPTGSCILHLAMLKGEPEVVAWLLYHHPELLTVADQQRDSPVVIALKELAATLLEHHRRPTDKTAWKRAKLAEILLSDQVQQFRVPWNLTHFRALGDIAVPMLGELVQQMALAFNLQPPAGFVRISKWSKYPGDIPDFLAQCYVACRDSVDTPRSELGDLGQRTFEALMRALEMKQTTITTPSNFFNCYPISIVRIDARANRLGGDMGTYAAHAIASNKTLTYLDLRFNNVDDDAGVELAKAIRASPSLTLVSLAQNRLGPGAGAAFGQALRKNVVLETLNLADNRLGPRLSYANEFRECSIPTSGPALCRGLRQNVSLTSLDVSNNNLGETAAEELDRAFRKNPRCALKFLGFASNDLRFEGGKHLAHALRSRVALTALDASTNRFGAGVGVAFAGALKKNHQLAFLNLNGNGLGTKGGRGLALAVQDNKTLVGLDLANNGFGPDVLRAFSAALLKANALTSLDLSGNDLTTTSHLGGEAEMTGGMLGSALQGNKVLTRLDLGGVAFETEELLAALTGFSQNAALRDVSLRGQPFDNANALTLCNALEIHRHRDETRGDDRPATAASSQSSKRKFAVVEATSSAGLQRVDLTNCDIRQRTGPVTVAALAQLPDASDILLAGNALGAKLGERIAELFGEESCTVSRLDVARNGLSLVGGQVIAESFEHNVSLTDLDMSDNDLPGEVGSAIADAMIELVESGFVARPAHLVPLPRVRNDILAAFLRMGVRCCVLAAGRWCKNHPRRGLLSRLAYRENTRSLRRAGTAVAGAQPNRHERGARLVLRVAESCGEGY